MEEQTTEQINITKIEYSERYNPHFRPISNKQTTTVEISPTGSGKTHFYKDSPNTIMLMPTNALDQQHEGLIAIDKASTGERSKWNERHTAKCDYMTYDKFYGHMQHENMSNLNIIIDEAHVILASLEDLHYELLRKLFSRAFKYKELKLISATLRHEILGIYNYRVDEPMQINQYIKTDFTPTIQFTAKLPIIDTNVKTLFFINSKDKMIQVKEYYEEICKGIKVTILSSEEMSNPPKLDEFDLILATCVLKQGYSIECHIDQVVIHNVYNAVGAMDIIQYMARPRSGQPKVYVIPASTHFKTEESKLFNVVEISEMLRRVSDKGEFTEEQYKMNEALVLNEFFAAAKTSQSSWNILAVTNFYEKRLKYHELHLKDGIHMTESIKSIIPNAIVKVEDLENGITLKFNMLKLEEDTKKMLEESQDISELKENIENIIKSTEEVRIINKMEKYQKGINNIIIDFSLTPKGESEEKKYSFSIACQVAQVLDDEVRRQCKQHTENIAKNVYSNRDSGDQRNRMKIEDEVNVSKLGRKLNFLKKLNLPTKYFNTQQDNIKLLEKLYCFKRYNRDGDEITNRSRKGVDKIKITSMSCVEPSWYNESTVFIRAKQA